MAPRGMGREICRPATEMRITSARFMNVISANVFIQRCTRYCLLNSAFLFRFSVFGSSNARGVFFSVIRTLDVVSLELLRGDIFDRSGVECVVRSDRPAGRGRLGNDRFRNLVLGELVRLIILSFHHCERQIERIVLKIYSVVQGKKFHHTNEVLFEPPGSSNDNRV